MSKGTSRWAIVGDVLISVTGPGIVGDNEFQVFLQDLRKEPVRKYFAATIGKPESSSLQRKQMAEIMTARGIRTATVTDDAVTRGLVTAMSWLGVRIKAFSWAESKAALQYLDVQEPWATKALETLANLRREVEILIG